MSDGVPGDEIVPPEEIEIGRHALRTFRIQGGKLRSLFQEFYWEGGKAVATCMADRSMGGRLVFRLDPSGNGRYTIDHSIPEVCETAPQLDCKCGLYGAVDMESLMNQYGNYAVGSFAVIAAEGSTIVGTKGLRTAAARIVGYWAYDDKMAEAYQDCDMATRYEDRSKLLSDFGFPEYDFAATPPHTDFGDCWCGSLHMGMGMNISTMSLPTPPASTLARWTVSHNTTNTKSITIGDEMRKKRKELDARIAKEKEKTARLTKERDRLISAWGVPPGVVAPNKTDHPGTETPRWWGRKKKA